MASEEHCIACFEALDAELTNRKPISLAEIQASWPAFKKSLSPTSSTGTSVFKNPALSHISSSPASSSSSSSSSLSLSPSTAATSIASSSSSPPSSPPSSAPLFVTWNTIDDDDDNDDDDNDDDEHNISLRGCIGTFEPQPLADGIPEYALISALQDSRFPPIAPRELPTLQAAVTLLTDFEEVDDPYDWDVGLHGIRLSFADRGRRFGSTYLPDVAKEQGWSKDEALFSLVRKAGWMGSRSRWKDLALRVTRYQGKKVSVNYPEYKRWRDWMATQK
ncbi:Uncharacterized protein ESCO_002697 [Escovopsis weberi]|uniref:AMMECR1 domain-containing protein n=1 Tax=Escovopsis weberi TaxID=150374 RepID=A0A0M8MWB7_ESCWE|nr:Uncharacterized protein ESCO_002697 [Escovopsis weberi]